MRTGCSDGHDIEHDRWKEVSGNEEKRRLFFPSWMWRCGFGEGERDLRLLKIIINRLIL